MPETLSPDDLIIWPDGDWCHRHELEDFTDKSDDFSVISAFVSEYDDFFRSLDRVPAKKSVFSSPAPKSLLDGLAAPNEAVQEVPSPSEKLAVLREEFRLKAQASSALLVRAPALRFKRKVDREDLPYQRAQNFSAGINARITVQVPVDYPLLNGDRVVGVIEIRVHSLDRLKGDDRLYTIKALELAAQRIRDDIEACA